MQLISIHFKIIQHWNIIGGHAYEGKYLLSVKAFYSLNSRNWIFFALGLFEMNDFFQFPNEKIQIWKTWLLWFGLSNVLLLLHQEHLEQPQSECAHDNTVWEIIDLNAAVVGVNKPESALLLFLLFLTASNYLCGYTGQSWRIYLWKWKHKCHI